MAIRRGMLVICIVCFGVLLTACGGDSGHTDTAAAGPRRDPAQQHKALPLNGQISVPMSLDDQLVGLSEATSGPLRINPSIRSGLAGPFSHSAVLDRSSQRLYHLAFVDSVKVDPRQPTEQQVQPGTELGRPSLVVRALPDGSQISAIDGVQSFALASTGRLAYARLDSLGLHSGAPATSTIFVSANQGDTPRSLALPKDNYYVYGWAADKLVVIAGSEQAPTRIYIVDTVSSTAILAEPTGAPVAVSPDGRSLLISTQLSTTQHLALVDTATGKVVADATNVGDESGASGGFPAQFGRWTGDQVLLTGARSLVRVHVQVPIDTSPSLDLTASQLPEEVLPRNGSVVESKYGSDMVSLIAVMDQSAAARSYELVTCDFLASNCRTVALPDGVLQPHFVDDSD